VNKHRDRNIVHRDWHGISFGKKRASKNIGARLWR